MQLIKEKYCQLKDEYIIYENFSIFKNFCKSCGSNIHPIYECPILLNRISKDFVIKKIRSQIQLKRIIVFRYRKKTNSSLKFYKQNKNSGELLLKKRKEKFNKNSSMFAAFLKKNMAHSKDKPKKNKLIKINQKQFEKQKRKKLEEEDEFNTSYNVPIKLKFSTGRKLQRNRSYEEINNNNDDSKIEENKLISK